MTGGFVDKSRGSSKARRVVRGKTGWLGSRPPTFIRSYFPGNSDSTVRSLNYDERLEYWNYGTLETITPIFQHSIFQYSNPPGFHFFAPASFACGPPPA